MVLDLVEKGEVDAARQAEAEERHARAQKAFGVSAPRRDPSSASNFQTGPTTPVAELEAARASSTKGMSLAPLKYGHTDIEDASVAQEPSPSCMVLGANL